MRGTLFKELNIIKGKMLSSIILIKLNEIAVLKMMSSMHSQLRPKCVCVFIIGIIGLTVVAHPSMEGAGRAHGFGEVVAYEADSRRQRVPPRPRAYRDTITQSITHALFFPLSHHLYYY